jgi:hypothetical protein
VSQGDPPAPVELEAAMRDALKGNQSPTPTEVLDAAERVLDNVLGTGCESRASALALLTVDALMTRAMEVACLDPELLEAFPERAMLLIGSHARG